MPTATIKTDQGFDFHTIVKGLKDDTETWADALGPFSPIASGSEFKAPIREKYSLLIEGEFNKNFTKGDPEQITLLNKNKALVTFTDFGIPLKDFLTTVYIGGQLTGFGFGVVDALVASLLLPEAKTDSISLFGGNGDDVMYYHRSSVGDVTHGRLFGRSGADTFEDRQGQLNKYDGETGRDTVTYSSITTSVTVNLGNANENEGEAGGDTYFSIENVVGTGQDDTLIGTKVKNKLDGEAGNDTLAGGAGADILNGGDGKDFASYDGSLFGVTVNLTNIATNTNEAKGDTFISIEGIKGSSHNDTLTGDASANIIYGGNGNDIIDGSGGTDELWGDSEEFGVDGDDTFVFHGPGSATDVKNIMDFDVFDHIEINRSGFGLHPLWVLNAGTTLIIAHSNPTATTNSPTFLVEQSTGDLFFDADGNGAGERQLIANVQFHSQEYLDQNDFVIV